MRALLCWLDSAELAAVILCAMLSRIRAESNWIESHSVPSLFARHVHRSVGVSHLLSVCDQFQSVHVWTDSVRELSEKLQD